MPRMVMEFHVCAEQFVLSDDPMIV
jgi:hypothetical protein